MKLWRSSLFLVLVAALLFAAACGGGGSSASDTGAASGNDEASEQCTVKVAHAPSTLFAPLYIADAKGYFADEGVDVQLETVKAGQDAIALTSAGRLDAVVAGFSAGMFSSLDSGLEFKVVGGMGVQPKEGAPSALMVSKKLIDSGEVKDIDDLKGRKIGVAGGEGAAGGYLLDKVLQVGGIGIEDVKVENLAFGDMVQAVESGALAAAYPPAPFTTEMERQNIAVNFATAPPGTTATGVIYGQQFANSDCAQPFFTALVRGARDLQGDQKKSEENLRILSKVTGQEISVLKEVPFYDWDPNLAPPVETLNDMQDTYRRIGLLEYEQDIPTDEYVDFSFSERAAREVGQQ